jgi:hypothetical protein
MTDYPAGGQTTSMRISNDLYCKIGRVQKDCVRRALEDLDQLIMFDDANTSMRFECHWREAINT